MNQAPTLLRRLNLEPFQSRKDLLHHVPTNSLYLFFFFFFFSVFTGKGKVVYGVAGVEQAGVLLHSTTDKQAADRQHIADCQAMQIPSSGLGYDTLSTYLGTLYAYIPTHVLRYAYQVTCCLSPPLHSPQDHIIRESMMMMYHSIIPSFPHSLSFTVQYTHTACYPVRSN